jgi:hypothetical protein
VLAITEHEDVAAVLVHAYGLGRPTDVDYYRRGADRHWQVIESHLAQGEPGSGGWSRELVALWGHGNPGSPQRLRYGRIEYTAVVAATATDPSLIPTMSDLHKSDPHHLDRFVVQRLDATLGALTLTAGLLVHFI